MSGFLFIFIYCAILRAYASSFSRFQSGFAFAPTYSTPAAQETAEISA